EDGIRDRNVTGVQTCALPISRRIVLLTGASGSGNTSLVRRLGIPTITLDDFYFDHDEPGLPERFGIVDWDDPATWNRRAAVEAQIGRASCRERGGEPCAAEAR